MTDAESDNALAALDADSSIGEWLEHPGGAAALGEVIAALGGSAEALAPVRALPLRDLTPITRGQVGEDLIEELVRAARTGAAPAGLGERVAAPVVRPFSGEIREEGIVRVYVPAAPNGAGLVWAHGGGFVHGTLDMPEADDVARALGEKGVTVMSVDYRLVGEGCRYPLPSDDLLAAWRWALANADDLGLDLARLWLGGASAGGNLAAGAALRLGETGETPPAKLVLAYPTLLAEQPAPSPELRAALDAHPAADVFGPAAVRSMYEQYLGGPVTGAPLPAVPGLAAVEDLATFPDTLIVTADIDELRVSAEHFAGTLRRAGRRVHCWTEPGSFHGFLNQPDDPAFAAAIDRISSEGAQK
jgi:acetyl esterase